MSKSESKKKPEFEVLNHEVAEDRLTVEVEVSSTVVTKAYKKTHRRLLRYVSIPGFRAGKAPLDVVANRVGREAFDEEVQSELLPRYYYRAVERVVPDCGRCPVGEVEYLEKNLAKGEPFRFKAAVDVGCDVELGDYDNLEIDVIEEEQVGEDEVDKGLEGLRRRMARMKSPGDGAAVEDDDLVRLRYEGSLDGEKYESLSGTAWMTIGDYDFLPGFDDLVKGLEKGGEKTFQYKLPDDYEPAHLAGREVEFKVEVLSFSRPELPELNDDFASSVGAFASIEDLRKKIREDLASRKKQERERKFTGMIREKLAAIAHCDIPRARIEERVNEMLDDARQEAQRRGFSSFERFLVETGKTEDELKEEYAGKVAARLRADYALDKIALSEGVEVSDKEVEANIALLASIYRKSPSELAEALDVTGSRILRKYGLMREKAFDMLCERYRVKAGMTADGADDSDGGREPGESEGSEG